MRGTQYDELIDELIEALRARYGAELIVHWEDFNVRNSFRLLDKYVDQVDVQLNPSVAPICSTYVDNHYVLDWVPQPPSS